MVFWEKWRREIFIDKDGSLSGKGSRTSISPFYAQFNVPIMEGKCTLDND